MKVLEKKGDNDKEKDGNDKTFELVSLDDFQWLQSPEQKLDECHEEQKFTLTFDDPYVIDDNFIEYAFNDNAFDDQALASSFNRVYPGNTGSSTSISSAGRFAKCLRSCCACFKKTPTADTGLLQKVMGAQRKSSPFTAVEMSQKSEPSPGVVFGAPIFKSNETLNWNPFRDRIILATAAIFFESVESYRAITSSTGVESFMDLLIVNGSKNLRKWKPLGSIDFIMDSFHKSKQLENSRIPALFQASSADKSKQWDIRCKKSDIKDRLSRASQKIGDFSADFSLHGPAVSSQVAVKLTGSNSGFTQNIVVSVDQKSFNEKLEWQPFQPGCIFQMKWPASFFQMKWPASAQSAKKVHVTKSPLNEDEMKEGHLQFTISDETRSVPDVNVQFVDAITAPNCHMHTQCFRALQKRVEEIESGEDEGGDDGSHRTLYAHQLLDAYKPKGTTALISPYLHSIVALAAVVPTLAFFGYLAYNQLIYYSMSVYWSLAIYFVIFAGAYIGLAVFYFMNVYLDFPYLFYGTSLVSYKINHFFFSPLTGAW